MISPCTIRAPRPHIIIRSSVPPPLSLCINGLRHAVEQTPVLPGVTAIVDGANRQEARDPVPPWPAAIAVAADVMRTAGVH
jgi:hypothetical protein